MEKLYIRISKNEIKEIDNFDEFESYAKDHKLYDFKPSIGYGNYPIEFTMYDDFTLVPINKNDLTDVEMDIIAFDSVIAEEVLDDLEEFGKGIFDFVHHINPEYIIGYSDDSIFCRFISLSNESNRRGY